MAHTSSAPSWLFQPLTPIELYILIVLAQHLAHPYYIASFVNQHFGLMTPTSPSSITRALARMDKHGWVKKGHYAQSSRRNEQAYELTDYGQVQLQAELDRIGPILLLAQDYLAVRSRVKAHEFTQ